MIHCHGPMCLLLHCLLGLLKVGYQVEELEQTNQLTTILSPFAVMDEKIFFFSYFFLFLERNFESSRKQLLMETSQPLLNRKASQPPYYV